MYGIFTLHLVDSYGKCIGKHTMHTMGSHPISGGSCQSSCTQSPCRRFLDTFKRVPFLMRNFQLKVRGVYTIVNQADGDRHSQVRWLFRKGPWSTKTNGSVYPSILSRWCIASRLFLPEILEVIQRTDFYQRASWWFVISTLVSLVQHNSCLLESAGNDFHRHYEEIPKMAGSFNLRDPKMIHSWYSFPGLKS